VALIELCGISKTYGTVEALRSLDLTVESGSLTVIVGPSGCGKTTLLRLIAGLENQSAGEIRIDGRRIDHLAPRERNIAMVFQNLALYPHLTAEENIAFPLRIQGTGKTEITRQVQETAEMLGIVALLERRPEQLSGGERQRVALGRAMVRKPQLFLLDEPLSSLDAKLRDELRRELLQLHKRLGTTMIYVTHDQTEAMTLADTIVVLESGVLQQKGGPAELYERPANIFVADFIGSPPMNFLPGCLEWREYRPVVCIGDVSCRLTVNWNNRKAEQGREIMVGIRPEEIQLHQDGTAPVEEGLLLEVMIRSVKLNGFQAVTDIETIDGLFRGAVLAPWKSRLWKAGDRACAFLPVSELHIFDPKSGYAI